MNEESKLPVEMQFKNISVNTKNGPILKGISHKFSYGMTCILGSSGSGKTTLIKILGGRSNIKYTGDIYFNGENVDKEIRRLKSGFVYQNDIFPEYMTVNEYINFCTTLKNYKLDYDFGLLKNKNTLIKDLSGGERKRLGISINLNSDTLFLDEPTSGLDLYTAYKTMKYLKGTGKRIIATIHQPSTHLLYLFDDMLVLHDGRIFYSGPVSDLVKFIQKLGFKIPNYVNPADFLFTTVLKSVEFKNNQFKRKRNEESEIEYKEVMTELLNEEMKKKILTGNYFNKNQELKNNELKNKAKRLIDPSTNKKIRKYGTIRNNRRQERKISFLSELNILLLRQFKINYRNKMIIFGRSFQTLASAIFVSLLYYNLSDKSEFLIYNSRGYFFFLLNFLFFGTTMGCVHIFYSEQDLYIRECKEKYYRALTLYISKIIGDTAVSLLYPVLLFPISYYFANLNYSFKELILIFITLIIITLVGHSIGIFSSIMFDNLSTTLLILPPVLTPLVSVCGFQPESESLTPILKYFQYISPPKYSYSILESIVLQKKIFLSAKVSIFIMICFYILNIVGGYLFLLRKLKKDA